MPDPEITVRQKRPIHVRTLLWTGHNPEQVIEFCGTIAADNTAPVFVPPGPDGWPSVARVFNSEECSQIDVPIGHHLAKGPLGEVYPISPAALEATYTLPAPAEPVDWSIITATIASNVLAHFGAGGYHPGTFTRRLIGLLAAADPANAARLRSVFPAYGVAVHLAQNTPDGIAMLHAAANPKESE